MCIRDSITVVFVWLMITASYLNPMEFLAVAPIVPILLFIVALFGFVALAYYLGGKKILKCDLVEAPVSYTHLDVYKRQVMRSRISLAKVITRPPASVRKPWLRWLGSWLCKDRPTCTMPHPSRISPTARILSLIHIYPEQAMDELHEQLFDPYVLIVR